MQEIPLAMTDEEFVVFAKCFCRDMPIPKIQSEEDPSVMVDEYTQLEWIKMGVISYLKKKGLKGYNKLVLDQNPPDAALMETMLSNL